LLSVCGINSNTIALTKLKKIQQKARLLQRNRATLHII